MDNNISFKANIQTNKIKIKESLLFDKYFNKQTNKNLKEVIKQVDELSTMKQKSTVIINPRLDNNQLNLITTVQDKSGGINTVITERSARKIATDKNFATRFVSNIKQAIINTEITRKELKQIKKHINKSKTLENKDFIENLPDHFIDSLKKGNNPTNRIISVLNDIEKNYPNDKNILSIKNERTKPNPGKSSKVLSYFIVSNSKGEHKIAMHSLLKDPVQNLFA